MPVVIYKYIGGIPNYFLCIINAYFLGLGSKTMLHIHSDLPADYCSGLSRLIIVAVGLHIYVLTTMS